MNLAAMEDVRISTEMKSARKLITLE
jgi:hypothetical protein